MPPADYTAIGIIQRIQGLRGHVVARLQYDLQNQPLEMLCLQMGQTLVPYKVESCVYKPQRAILKLQGVDHTAAAYALKGAPIFVPQDAFAQIAGQAAALAVLQGYQVVDTQLGTLGTVQDIYERPLQPLLVIDHAEKELLIPYHEDIVTHIDHAQKHLNVQLPAGFLET